MGAKNSNKKQQRIYTHAVNYYTLVDSNFTRGVVMKDYIIQTLLPQINFILHKILPQPKYINQKSNSERIAISLDYILFLVSREGMN